MRSINHHVIIVVLVLTSFPTLICAADYMYWNSNFDPISLLNITSRVQTREGSTATILYTSGNAQISADNNPIAQLSCATDTLVTEYKLTYDDGDTGGETVDWTDYSTFLTTPADVTYVPDDDDVEVTLWVRVNNNPDEVADSDTYSATQTLTVSWVGP